MVRGTESSWRVDWTWRRRDFREQTLTGTIACVVLMTGVGGYIFYNTNVLNPYATTFKIDEWRAQYEKKYRQYWSLPQPRITDVTTEVDIIRRSVRFSPRHHVAGKQDVRRYRSHRADGLASRPCADSPLISMWTSSALPAARPR